VRRAGVRADSSGLLRSEPSSISRTALYALPDRLPLWPTSTPDRREPFGRVWSTQSALQPRPDATPRALPGPAILDETAGIGGRNGDDSSAPYGRSPSPPRRRYPPRNHSAVRNTPGTPHPSNHSDTAHMTPPTSRRASSSDRTFGPAYRRARIFHSPSRCNPGRARRDIEPARPSQNESRRLISSACRQTVMEHDHTPVMIQPPGAVEQARVTRVLLQDAQRIKVVSRDAAE